MTKNEAKEKCEKEGFPVIELLESGDGYFRFLCEGDSPEDEITVFVREDTVTVEPT